MKRSIPKSLYLGSVFVSIIIIGLFVGLFFNSNNVKKASAQATEFQAGHIIDNNIFTNSNALTTAQIQVFLNDMVRACDTNGIGVFTAPNGQVMTHAQWGTSKGDPPPYTCINNYYENTSTLQNNYSNPGSIPSGAIPAAQIIYNAAQAYQINPEVILTTLQKEQGLVTDNWPWYSEYQHAMGYACPDSSGCSSSYADFYKQVDSAAWQFRDYLNNPGAFNYWIGTNTIGYAPGCNGGTVDIQNAATAALYIYTPYQPDSNVIANTNPIGSSSGPGPSISDSCAGYGNRNFWWYFNSWFGPSIDTNVSLGIESGGSTVYVLYDGQKQGIPNPDVLSAWGLNGLPLTTLDPAVFNAIPTASTALTRYAINGQTGLSYFADNGNVYYVSANDAGVWGNFPGQTLAQITSSLVNFADFRGEIKPFVYASGSTAYYAVDNGNLHAFNSIQSYLLWSGGVWPLQISSAYINTMPQASVISSPEFTYNNSDYVLSDGQMFSLNSNIATLMPSNWAITTIGLGLYSTFTNAGPLNYMIRTNNNSTVYLLNGGAEWGIPDPQTYTEFMVDSSSDTSTVSSDLLNAIPDGSVLSSNIVKINSQYYVVDNGLQPIPSNLINAYNPSATSISLSSAYQNMLNAGSNQADATAFVKTTSSSGIYFLDGGDKLPFSNPTTFTVVAGNTPITYLTNDALGNFTTGPFMQSYFTNGTSSYLLDMGNAYSVTSTATATAWGLSSPVTISSSGMANFPVVGNLSQHVQLPNGYFCLVDNQALYCAPSNAMISLWGLLNNVIHPSQTLLNNQNLASGQFLTRFVSGLPGQLSAGTLYTISNGQIYGIKSINDALNLGYNGSGVLYLSQSTISPLFTGIWQGYSATDDSGNTWVLDGGVKRNISSQNNITAWAGSNTPTPLGTVYLSLLPTGSNVGDAIKTNSNPTYFAIIGGKEYGIPTWQLYVNYNLDPVTTVSQSLINSIPDGGVLQ
jgi:hypothetical protein